MMKRLLKLQNQRQTILWLYQKKEIRKYERLIKKRATEDKNKTKNTKNKMGTRTMPQYLYMV